MGALVHFITQILEFFKGITGTYGSAIIITTIIIRLILLPLSIKQEQIQRKQMKLQPKMKVLEQKYKGNKRSPEFMKAQRELMKEEGANPLLGCLPVIIQLPIFIALYRALSPHYSQTPITGKYLWFDLVEPDKAFMIGAFAVNLLPIISALLQLLLGYLTQKQTTHPHIKKLNEVQEESMNDKMTKQMGSMMYIMPIVMLFIFYRLPSGLNVYYIITTLFSIVQTAIFLRTRRGFYKKLEAEVEEVKNELYNLKKNEGKKSKKENNKENKKEIKAEGSVSKEKTVKKSLRKTKTKEEILEMKKIQEEEKKKKGKGKNKKKIMDPLDKKED